MTTILIGLGILVALGLLTIGGICLVEYLLLRPVKIKVEGEEKCAKDLGRL